jgi:hypothetical protein
MKITANRPRFSVDALLAIRSVEADAAASLVLHGQVASGVVDRVELLADKSWRGPFSSEPNSRIVARPLPQNADRQLIQVELDKPVEPGKEFVLQVSGKLPLEVDQRVRFPRVQVQGATEQRLFLALPETPDSQTAEWTIRGLQREDLPRRLAAEINGASSGASYRALGDRFVAEQRLFPVALRQASVRLSKTEAVLDAKGRWSAATELIIQPGSAIDIAVQLPSGARLLQAAVNGRAEPRPAFKAGVWRLPSGPRYLPRIVSVGYQLADVTAASSFELQAPKALIDGRPLPVDRALWRIQGEPAANLVSNDRAVAINEAAFSTASRRETLATALDAAPLALQLAEWEYNSWFRPWVERLPIAGDTLEGVNAAPEAAWNRLRERLSVDVNAAEVDPDHGAPADSIENTLTRTAWYQSASGDQLTLVPAPRGLGAGRWLLALALGGAGLAAWRNPAQIREIVAATRRWPAVVGIAFGLLWWALLAPVLIGPVIVALSLASLFKSRQFRSAADASVNSNGSESPLSAAL